MSDGRASEAAHRQLRTPVAQKSSRAGEGHETGSSERNRESLRPERLGIENCDANHAKETRRGQALRGHMGGEQGHTANEARDSHHGRAHRST